MNGVNLCVDPSFRCPNRIDKNNSKWKKNGQEMVDNGFPLQLDIELNNNCNFRCPNCPQSTENILIEYMPLSLFRSLILEGISEPNFESIKLQYRGEPLLYPQFIDALKFAKSFGLYVHFNTNGSLLTNGIINALIEYKVDKVIFSIDSSNPTVYNRMRKGGDFHKIFRNILKLYTEKLKRDSKYPRIRVQAVYCNDNKEEIDSGRYNNLFEIVADEVGYEDMFDFTKPLYDKTELPNWHCGQLWQRLVILSDGTVLPCCGGIDHPRGVIYGLGNVRDNTLHDIWNGEVLNKYRELHRNGLSHEVDMCARCRVRLYVVNKLKEVDKI